MDTKGVLGGMWADREGYVDTTGTVWAYAKAAKKLRADVIENNKVEKLLQTGRNLDSGNRKRNHKSRTCS